MKITPELLDQLKQEESYLKAREEEAYKKWRSWHENPLCVEFFKDQRDWLDATREREKVSNLLAAMTLDETSR